MSKTIAIIPARGGSKRLPNKNLKMLNGLPLIVHSIQYAFANKNYIDDVYVTTDNKDIKDVAIKYGAKVIDRPTELSGDLEPVVTAVKHAIEIIKDVSAIVLLQPTNPLRPESLLKDACKVIEDYSIDSLFTVSRDHKKLGKINDNQFRPFNYTIGQRSQDLEPLYYENGLLYIAKVALINKGSIFDNESYPLVVNHKFAEIDIDTQHDFDYAEYILKNYNER